MFLFVLALSAAGTACSQVGSCDPSGNQVLFTNYDGGVLIIDVDVDVPNVRIGVVAFNAVRIEVTGEYADNVVQVAYAGVNADAGDYCGDGPVSTTTVTGVPPNDVSIAVAPPSVLANTFGHPDIICAYSCVLNEWQGGCNTADQIEAYFAAVLGGTLRSHTIQYDCWSGGYAISEQVSCCGPSLGVGQLSNAPGSFSFVGAELLLGGASGAIVMDASGRVAMRIAPGKQGRAVRVAQLPPGLYAARAGDGSVLRFVVQR